MKLVKGVTRYVILTKKWAIKFPSFYNWPLFLTGLLANMQERDWSGFNDRLCPVKFCCWGGWFLVMPRCEPVAEEEIDYAAFAGLPSDLKPCNFGKYQGRVVMLDYGS